MNLLHDGYYSNQQVDRKTNTYACATITLRAGAPFAKFPDCVSVICMKRPCFSFFVTAGGQAFCLKRTFLWAFNGSLEPGMYKYMYIQYIEYFASCA